MQIVNLFGVGGAGIDCVKTILEDHIKQDDSQLAQLNVILVDTSVSNYKRNEDFFKKHGVSLTLIPDLDGNGQVRKSNIDKIMPHTAGIINNHTTDDDILNVIIHSASGGSGSVISVLLMKDLMAENRNVLSMVVGDATTRNYAHNTQATLRSYESIARQAKKPAVIKYFQNYAKSAVSPKLSPQEVNKKVSQAVLDLRILTSGNVHGVDSADITNFLDYTKVSSVPASLTLLTNIVTPVDSDERELERVLKTDLDDTQPISVITINTTDDTEHQEIKCTYRVEGKFDYSSKEKSLFNVHFTIHDSYLMACVIEDLTKNIQEFDKKENVRVRTTIDVSNSDNESGLVF